MKSYILAEDEIELSGNNSDEVPVTFIISLVKSIDSEITYGIDNECFVMCFRYGLSIVTKAIVTIRRIKLILTKIVSQISPSQNHFILVQWFKINVLHRISITRNLPKQLMSTIRLISQLGLRKTTWLEGPLT